MLRDFSASFQATATSSAGGCRRSCWRGWRLARRRAAAQPRQPRRWLAADVFVEPDLVLFRIGRLLRRAAFRRRADAQPRPGRPLLLAVASRRPSTRNDRRPRSPQGKPIGSRGWRRSRCRAWATISTSPRSMRRSPPSSCREPTARKRVWRCRARRAVRQGRCRSCSAGCCSRALCDTASGGHPDRRRWRLAAALFPDCRRLKSSAGCCDDAAGGGPSLTGREGCRNR